jgi:uncharacterized membrane protein
MEWLHSAHKKIPIDISIYLRFDGYRYKMQIPGEFRWRISMKEPLFACTILTALLTAHSAGAADANKKDGVEKCYGIAKAGKNDCAAKDGRSSCAGHAQKTGDANDWIYVPKGLCDKISGGAKG